MSKATLKKMDKLLKVILERELVQVQAHKKEEITVKPTIKEINGDTRRKSSIKRN